jgi:hypothetical protein
MRRSVLLGTLALAAVVILVLVAIAAATGTSRSGKATSSATPVFKLFLQPRQEVPPLDLRAFARGNVTFDLTRDSDKMITEGEVVFYFNYRFKGPIQIVGLHIHVGARGVNGPIVVDSGVTPFMDADGKGNITTLVTGVDPALLQAILDNPRGYYVNLHTSVNPSGAMRDQLGFPMKL